jgi:hypothetical protein
MAEPTPPSPGTPPTPTGKNSGSQPAGIINLPGGYTDSKTVIPCAKLLHNVKDTEHDTDYDPDLLTDEG